MHGCGPCQNHWMFPYEARVLPDHEGTVWVHWEEMFVASRPLCEEVEANSPSLIEPHGAEFLSFYRMLMDKQAF